MATANKQCACGDPTPAAKTPNTFETKKNQAKLNGLKVRREIKKVSLFELRVSFTPHVLLS